MSWTGIVTSIGLSLLVLALAIYLTVIVGILRKVNFALGTVLIGVRAIAQQAEPLQSTLAEVGEDVQAIVNALNAVAPPATTAQTQAGPRVGTGPGFQVGRH